MLENAIIAHRSPFTVFERLTRNKQLRFSNASSPFDIQMSALRHNYDDYEVIMGLIVRLKLASGTQLCERINCMCDNERVKYPIVSV